MNTSKSLDAYHLHSCQSRQAWAPHANEPFPCDCGLWQAIVEAEEGLIGEDEPRPYKLGKSPKLEEAVENAKVAARNWLRADQRKAIKEWQ